MLQHTAPQKLGELQPNVITERKHHKNQTSVLCTSTFQPLYKCSVAELPAEVITPCSCHVCCPLPVLGFALYGHPRGPSSFCLLSVSGEMGKERLDPLPLEGMHPSVTGSNSSPLRRRSGHESKQKLSDTPEGGWGGIHLHLDNSGFLFLMRMESLVAIYVSE